MRYTSRQYARALASACTEPNADIPRIAERLVKILARERRLRDVPRIIDLLHRYQNEARGVVDAEITTVRAVSDTSAHTMTTTLRKALGAAEIVLKKNEDPSLIGGARIRYGDTVIDGSVQRALYELARTV